MVIKMNTTIVMIMPVDDDDGTLQSLLRKSSKTSGPSCLMQLGLDSLENKKFDTRSISGQA